MCSSVDRVINNISLNKEYVDKKKVSVIIPVYNSSKYLSECLESVIGQTYTDIEIICVNDGSTDNSLQILEEYARKDDRIIVVTKENEGKGAASARNLGLSLATGRYVHFVDSDDFFDCNMEELLVNKALETDADVVICDADRYDEKEHKGSLKYNAIDLSLAPKIDVFSWRDISDKLYQLTDIVTWNKLYRKEILDKHELRFEPIPISDDQYVPILSLVYAERLAVVKKPLIHYRVNTGSSQADSYSRNPDSAYLATYSVIDRLKKEGIYEDVKRSYLCTTVRLMRFVFDAVSEYDKFLYLYDKYKNEVLPKMEATDLPIDYFYDKHLDEWYQMIIHESIGEILFKVVRAYTNQNTRVLRDKIGGFY